MVVYKVEKSNVLMLLQTNWDLELKDSSKSFEFLNIHIWLKPLQNLGKKGLVEHLVILVSSTVLQLRSRKLKRSTNTKATSVFKDRDVVEIMSIIHDKYVVIPADKATNNIELMSTPYYK
jgi:hypothetical protein